MFNYNHIIRSKFKKYCFENFDIDICTQNNKSVFQIIMHHKNQKTFYYSKISTEDLTFINPHILNIEFLYRIFEATFDKIILLENKPDIYKLFQIYLTNNKLNIIIDNILTFNLILNPVNSTSDILTNNLIKK